MSTARDEEKLASFLAEKLEYLPLKQQEARSRSAAAQHDKSLHATSSPVAAPAIAIDAKRSGFILPPTPEQLAVESSDGNFYDEVNEKKKKNWDKAIKMFKYNPFVPIGCLITIGVLLRGVKAMKNKDRSMSQRMMRWRVAAQGATVIALVAGTMIANHIAGLPTSEDNEPPK